MTMTSFFKCLPIIYKLQSLWFFLKVACLALQPRTVFALAFFNIVFFFFLNHWVRNEEWNWEWEASLLYLPMFENYSLVNHAIHWLLLLVQKSHRSEDGERGADLITWLWHEQKDQHGSIVVPVCDSINEKTEVGESPGALCASSQIKSGRPRI